MISFKNWNKEGYAILNKIAYAGLALVLAVQGAEAMGYTLDFLTDKQKKVFVFCVVGFKWIEKLTAKKDNENDTPTT